MLQNRIRESLTARIFLITVMILLGAGAITFGFIAWATPSTYTAVVNDELTQQVDALVEQLSSTDVDGAGSLLDAFIQSTGTAAMLVGPDGKVADTGSRLAVQAVYEDDSTVVTVSESDFSNSAAAGTGQTGDAVSVTMSEQATITAEVEFSGQTGTYTLYVTPRMQAENLAVQALIQMAPWLLLVLAAFSLLCALAYSRYITRPIVRISGIAEKMAELGLGFLGVEHFTVGTEETGVQVHRILLGAEIALLEACTLEGVPAGEYLLVSPPLKYGGLDGAQARPLLLRD